MAILERITRNIDNRYWNPGVEAFPVKNRYTAGVAGQRFAQVPGHGQQAGVLARAVVVDGIGMLATHGKFGDGARVTRWLYPAAEIGRTAADVCQPGAHCLQMYAFMVVRGAGEGDTFIAKSEGVGSARLEQRQRLHGFDGGAWKHRQLVIAEAGDDALVGTHHHRVHVVRRLDDGAAGDFYAQCRIHARQYLGSNLRIALARVTRRVAAHAARLC